MSNNFNRATISQQLQSRTNQLKKIEQNELQNYQANLNQQYQNALNHSMSDFALTITDGIANAKKEIMSSLSSYDTIPQTIENSLNKANEQILQVAQNFTSHYQSAITNQDKKLESMQNHQNQVFNDLEQWKADTIAQLTTNKQLPLATWIALIIIVAIGAITQLTLIIINGKTWLWLSLCLATIVIGVAVWAVTVAIKKANSESE